MTLPTFFLRHWWVIGHSPELVGHSSFDLKEFGRVGGVDLADGQEAGREAHPGGHHEDDDRPLGGQRGGRGRIGDRCERLLQRRVADANLDRDDPLSRRRHAGGDRQRRRDP